MPSLDPRSPTRRSILLCLLALAVPLPVLGQEPGQGHRHADHQPYADLTDREIKALGAEEVRALLEGEGMGFALAAELNGLPGPRHVLDLAAQLELSGEQESEVREIFDAMQERARRLGGELVRRERHLDRAFAGGSASPESVEQMSLHIAEVRGELRAVHLVAHLRTIEILTPDQVEAYRRARGYVGG